MELESARALKADLSAELRTLRYRALGETDMVLGEQVLDRWATRRAKPPVALGIARGQGSQYALAVRVQEERLVESSVVASIRNRARGEVDVRYIGRPTPLAAVDCHRDRCRPLRAGASVGSHAQRTTGTIGGFVRPVGGGPLHLLSNAHVLVGWGKGEPGDGIVQPGWDDHGRDEEAQVGTLAEWIPLRSDAMNEVDCAIAVLDSGLGPGEGTVTEAAQVDVDEIVVKDGRTTGRTTGRVLAIEAGPIEFDYPKPLGTLEFEGVMEVDGVDPASFARRGDSGALVLTDDGRPAGLVYAVTDVGGRNGHGIVYVCPLATALERLKVELVE